MLDLKATKETKGELVYTLSNDFVNLIILFLEAFC